MKAIVFLLVVVSLQTGAGQSSIDTVKWLRESSFDLQTTNPEIEIQGIPFKEILTDVKMVMVGEATHGAREFAQIKHRLFSHLALKQGVRYLLIEADFAAGLSMDHYLQSDGGDPIKALKSLRYFHIVNKEGLALINWMKQYNSTKKVSDKVRFFGIDCQESESALAMLKDYFLRVDSAFHVQTKGIMLRNHHSTVSASELDRKYPTMTLSIDTAEMLRARLLRNRTRYIEASSEMEYKIAVKLLDVMVQAFEINTGNDGYRKREEFMAENATWILNEIAPSNAKALLWAHNVHVMYGEVTDRQSGAVFGTLGSMIRDRLKGSVYSVGLDFNRGSFVANEVKYDTIVKKVWTLGDAPSNVFPYFLSRTGMQVLFMDFASMKNENLASWLRGNFLRGHGIGGVFYPAYRLRRYNWPKNFDGLIFVNEIHEVGLEFP